MPSTCSGSFSVYSILKHTKRMQEDIIDPTKVGVGPSNRTERIKAAAAVKIREGKEKARQIHTTAEDYVREHPTKSVLGAFGVGILIGLVIRR